MNTFEAHEKGHVPMYMAERWSQVNELGNPFEDAKRYRENRSSIRFTCGLASVGVLVSLFVTCLIVARYGLVAEVTIPVLILLFFLAMSAKPLYVFLAMGSPLLWQKYERDIDSFMHGFGIDQFSDFDQYPTPQLLQLVVNERFRSRDVQSSLSRNSQLYNWAAQFGFVQEWNVHCEKFKAIPV